MLVIARFGLDTGAVTLTNLLTSILNWLRAGYPEGVPRPDRVPLLALLRATPLTDKQIKEIVGNLTAADLPAVTGGGIAAVRPRRFGTGRRSGPSPGMASGGLGPQRVWS